MTTRNSYITPGDHRRRDLDTGENAPVMLLLHGISSVFGFYEPVIPIQTRSFRVLGLDLPGFGQSGKPQNAPCSLQLCAALIDIARDCEAFETWRTDTASAHHPGRPRQVHGT